eukprot:2644777-Prymnesium_polylepis.2
MVVPDGVVPAVAVLLSGTRSSGARGRDLYVACLDELCGRGGRSLLVCPVVVSDARVYVLGDLKV